MLDLTITRCEDLSLITVRGVLDCAHATGVLLDSLLFINDSRDLVFDLTEITEMDDCAATELRRLFNVRPTESEWVIVTPSTSTRETLVRHDLQRLVPIAESLEDAGRILQARTGRDVFVSPDGA